MIEIIGKENREEKEQKRRSLPKNVRQIGECVNKCKIYIEDYVVTYLNKMARPDQVYARGAILFGDIYETEEGPAVFINGAIEAGNLELDMDEVVFDENIWRELIEKGEKYFPGQEVAGWFLSRMGFSVEMNQKIINTHRKNFFGDYKVLYMIDSLEKEDAMYLFENQTMIRQKGYYIYYEKNSAMQDYMLEAEGAGKQISEEERGKSELRRDRKIVNNYRRMSRYRKESKKLDVRIKAVRAACAALIFVMGIYIAGKLGNRFVNVGFDDYAIATFQAAKNVFLPEKTKGPKEETKYSENLSGIEGNLSAEDRKEPETVGIEEKQEVSQQETLPENQFGPQRKEDAENTEDELKETASYRKPLYYVVQKGDTLAGISRKMYSTDKYTYEIAKANELPDENHIYEGQKILIPSIE